MARGLSFHVAVSYQTLTSSRPGSGLHHLLPHPDPQLLAQCPAQRVHSRKFTSVRDSGETPGKAFRQLGLGDGNKQSPSLRASKKRTDALPQGGTGHQPQLPCSQRERGWEGKEGLGPRSCLPGPRPGPSAWTRNRDWQEPLLGQALECWPPPRVLRSSASRKPLLHAQASLIFFSLELCQQLN